MGVTELLSSWKRGRARLTPEAGLELAPAGADLAGKLRRTYAWLAGTAVFTAQRDVAIEAPEMLRSSTTELGLVRGESWSSFLLFPLLTLATRRRLVFVGAPGRGKTGMATLMALLAGHDPDEVRRGVQHGHPQLTVADLLGAPLPSELVRAREPGDIRVAWKAWLTMRVKIVDEYNRIPTKTQSALLSLMAEGYAECYEQVVRTGDSAWFLTANDDLGGGTFPVIEALKDRIDVAVRCPPMQPGALALVDARIRTGGGLPAPPAELVFTAKELDELAARIREVPLAPGVLPALAFFAAWLEFCGRASDEPEHQTKDTLHLAGIRVSQVCTEDCPLDKNAHLCSQTEAGISARAAEAALHYARALAWFRGSPEATMADLREVLPAVLLLRLEPNAQSPGFLRAARHLTDRRAWIRRLFERATDHWSQVEARRRPLAEIGAELGRGGVAPDRLRELVATLAARAGKLVASGEAGGPLVGDLLHARHLHALAQDQLARQERLEV